MFGISGFIDHVHVSFLYRQTYLVFRFRYNSSKSRLGRTHCPSSKSAFLNIKKKSVLHNVPSLQPLLSNTLFLSWMVPDSKLDELASVLKYMRPLISKTHFNRVDIVVNHPEVYRASADLLDGSSAKELRFNAFNNTNSKDRIEIADLYVLKIFPDQ